MANANPEKIGRYQILERVGKGGMGVLFRGVDSVLDREVAIKLMLLDFSTDADDMRPRFYREAKAVAKLQHPNIVTVFEFAEEGGTPYIVMEFLRGTSLAERMTAAVPLTMDDKLNIVAQLCSALGYAHEQGVVHRDVKPANIFIMPDGTVKLLDFGVAKLTTSTMTRQGDVLGSASYMSPEQVAGSESVDGRADIFAAGVVLYELLAGRRPYEADSPTAIIVKILYEDPTPIESVAPGLPPALVAAVKKALSKNAADRFQTAADFARELQIIRRALPPAGSAVGGFEETRFASATEMKALQQELASVRPPAAPPAAAASTASETATSAAAPSGGTKWLVPALIGVLAIAGVGGAYMFMHGSSEPPATSNAAAVTAATATPPAAGTAAPRPREGAAAAGASATKAAPEPAAAEKPKPAAAPKISVLIESPYPVEVFQGSSSISGAKQSHSLSVAVGSTIRVVSSEYLLEMSVKVDGKEAMFTAPALGYLAVRANAYGACSAKIGAHSLGDLPVPKTKVASGNYHVDLVCPNGKNPLGKEAQVKPGEQATVLFE